jgi:hypothetical protein
VNLAEKIYGKDIASIKGKTTRRKPSPAVQNMVDIPPELINALRNVDLCFDTVHRNGMPFLSTISKRIKYRTIEWIPERIMKAYKNALKNIIKIYNTAGFKVSTLSCDREYIPLINAIQDEFNITPNFPSAQEHVPEAERNNRVMKVRIRAVFHTLPFKTIPKIMIKFLAMECTKKLEYFPPNGGVSKYCSPREILHQQKLDYNKHCTIAQFSYVQAHDEPQPSNSQMPRALDCIYLRPLANLQGGHEILHLATGRVITRRQVTVIPMSTSAIKFIENMAAADGMKNLQLTTRSGKIIYDLTWIAVVDFTEDEDGEESYHYQEDDDDASHDDIDPNKIAAILHEQPVQAQLTESNRNDTQEEIYQTEEEEYDVTENEYAEGYPDNNQSDGENDNNQSGGEGGNEEDEIPVPAQQPQQMRRSARTAKPTAKYLTYVGGNYGQIADRT